ncbi:class 1 fructose-bisphosphatase [Saccharophagus degradans]|uniref:Fructose-1,6-bisphosphatase class 1 n=1 Tax=Saccharophagus degradans TaxID=86304 RepID=A0AAW7X6S6_9GAMM|nr:class 1 fructose-bisphosphatase [Saccharophagus degradans]MDO6422990.1 class 1 fructose-bisphosphatase [Saccharophagus degradans]MDO6607135.1 class 1 fructose-bisphosphatase [Saccharophagus degradans]
MQNLQGMLRDQRVAQDLQEVIFSIELACKDIAKKVQLGALAGVLGATESENVQGETQKKLDVISNDILKASLAANSNVLALASEEEDNVVAANAGGRYVVAFDPLDGSSNIDINGQIGTIFTIFEALDGVAANSDKHFLQQGHKQVCAGYVLYGASTLMVITVGGPTSCFTLDPATQTFSLTNNALQVPAQTQEFAVNMANERFWLPKFKGYVADLKLGEEGVRGKRFNMRWNASMVGDVHRVLMRGGIFMYPSDTRNPKQPAKLRLLYEANPMALLIERAGGNAFNETQRILDVTPSALHERIAVILGSEQEVATCLEYLN